MLVARWQLLDVTRLVLTKKVEALEQEDEEDTMEEEFIPGDTKKQ